MNKEPMAWPPATSSVKAEPPKQLNIQSLIAACEANFNRAMRDVGFQTSDVFNRLSGREPYLDEIGVLSYSFESEADSLVMLEADEKAWVESQSGREYIQEVINDKVAENLEQVITFAIGNRAQDLLIEQAGTIALGYALKVMAKINGPTIDEACFRQMEAKVASYGTDVNCKTYGDISTEVVVPVYTEIIKGDMSKWGSAGQRKAIPEKSMTKRNPDSQERVARTATKSEAEAMTRTLGLNKEQKGMRV